MVALICLDCKLQEFTGVEQVYVSVYSHTWFDRFCSGQKHALHTYISHTHTHTHTLSLSLPPPPPPLSLSLFPAVLLWIPQTNKTQGKWGMIWNRTRSKELAQDQRRQLLNARKTSANRTTKIRKWICGGCTFGGVYVPSRMPGDSYQSESGFCRCVQVMSFER